MQHFATIGWFFSLLACCKKYQVYFCTWFLNFYQKNFSKFNLKFTLRARARARKREQRQEDDRRTQQAEWEAKFGWLAWAKTLLCELNQDIFFKKIALVQLQCDFCAIITQFCGIFWNENLRRFTSESPLRLQRFSCWLVLQKRSTKVIIINFKKIQQKGLCLLWLFLLKKIIKDPPKKSRILIEDVPRKKIKFGFL